MINIRIIINEDGIEYISGIGKDSKILWKDVKKIGYTKGSRIIGTPTMIIYFPYEVPKNEYKDININSGYINHMDLWKEVVLRCKANNPDVEIAEEFEEIFK